MKKIFFILGFISGLVGQKDFVIPFDWGGQNGSIIHNGRLFWNQSWTSGILLFDGTYTTYPIRYGPHTSKKFIGQRMDLLPAFSRLPDSTNNNSYLDYYRGDYSYDQLELGANFESKNEMIEIRGFKRSHGGNVGHYIHPLGGSSPLHHSYRVNYGIKRGNKKYEASVARYVTRSGLPDSLYNGAENDNIISAGLRYQQQFAKFKIDSYFGQFLQHRKIQHTSVTDSNYNDINRVQFILNLGFQNNSSFGIRHDSQQINIFNLNRLVNWTTFYGSKSYGDFSILAGFQLINPDQSNSVIWSINYKKNIGRGFFQLESEALTRPVHPNSIQKIDNSNFENWKNNKIKFGIESDKISTNGFYQINNQVIDSLTNRISKFIGLEINYNFANSWNIYSFIISQLDTSYIGGGLGTISAFGVKGNFKLLNNNMDIRPHFWTTGTNGRVASFGFDPFNHIPFENTNPNWVIDDKLIFNFEVTTNISGVLIHYKINNLLNAFGNDKIWIQNNHMYQKIGRMIQFGVTWNFTN